LAYYCLGDVSGDHWVDFWKEWKDHNKKAYRAFFYEFFCLLRIELEGMKEYFPTKRKSLPIEKEVSFYVDFDHESGKVLLPYNEIDNIEILNRVSSLIGPMNSALKVKDLIQKNEHSQYRLAISNYALNTLTSNIYQQNVKTVLNEMKKGISEYDRALQDIWELFNPNK
jgi:hypothetical protein